MRTRQEIQEIIGLYKFGFSSEMIGEMFELTGATILRLLKKQNIKPRNFTNRYNLNKNLFKKITKPWESYFLGWIFSDGCITPHGTRLFLAAQDKIILDYFNQKIYKGKFPLYRVIGDTQKFPNGITSKIQDRYSLTLNNPDIRRNLINFGLKPNKSLDLKWPMKIPEKLMSHFIRGVFEGDGCVSIGHGKNKANKSVFIVSGSYCFIYGMRNFLFKLGIKMKVRKDKNRDNTLYYLVTGDYLNIKKFFDYIYQNPCFKLDRKYNKFLEIFKRRDKSIKDGFTSRMIKA